MKRTRRSSSQRAIRLISFALSYALIVTTVFLPLSPAASGAAKGTNTAVVSSSSRFSQAVGILAAPGRLLASLITFLQGGGPPSVPGTGLPDLDAARSVSSSDPVAPAAIVSDQACTDCTPCPTCGPPPSSDLIFASMKDARMTNSLVWNITKAAQKESP